LIFFDVVALIFWLLMPFSLRMTSSKLLAIFTIIAALIHEETCWPNSSLLQLQKQTTLYLHPSSNAGICACVTAVIIPSSAARGLLVLAFPVVN
jgi:hypothetical protein